MEISRLKKSCECEAFKCSDDCKSPHKSKSEKQLEVILKEMLGMSGILKEEPHDPNGIEPLVVSTDNNVISTDNNESPNSIWVPIIKENIPCIRQNPGDTFNEKLLVFNDYVRETKEKSQETPPPGTIYPSRIHFENIQDNLMQDREKMRREKKQRNFYEGVRQIAWKMQKLEANKPAAESPLRPPVYPCQFEREGILWDEMKEKEVQVKNKDQKKLDKRVAEVSSGMNSLKCNSLPPKSPQKPPVPIPVGAVSSRQIRKATEAKTREMFSNKNMRKYNTCWSKTFKPVVLQTPTPANRPHQREVDTRGIVPPVKCSPLYKNSHIEMAAYEKNREYFENLESDKLRDYFRSAYGMHR